MTVLVLVLYRYTTGRGVTFYTHTFIALEIKKKKTIIQTRAVTNLLVFTKEINISIRQFTNITSRRCARQEQDR